MSESFLSQISANADQPVQVIVRYANADAMSAVNSVAAAGETGLAMGQQYELIPAQVVTGSPQALRELEKSPLVDRIWEDLPVHTLLDVSAPKIHAPQLWNLGFDGRGIKVAVVDTGIDRTHPDFEDRVIAVRDFTNSSPDALDGNGHGTHVASTIAGSGSASGGRYIGVAPEALLLAAKVLKDNGSGMTSGVMAGVDWAVQQGAQVINLSLSFRFSSQLLAEAKDALEQMKAAPPAAAEAFRRTAAMEKHLASVHIGRLVQGMPDGFVTLFAALEKQDRAHADLLAGSMGGRTGLTGRETP